MYVTTILIWKYGNEITFYYHYYINYYNKNLLYYPIFLRVIIFGNIHIHIYTYIFIYIHIILYIATYNN